MGRVGRAIFVAMLLLLAGILNVIYGIGALSNAHFFDNPQYTFAHLHTWGWITIIVGAIQLIAALSLFSGGGFGRIIGIFAAAIGALESLLQVGGARPPLGSGCLRHLPLDTPPPRGSGTGAGNRRLANAGMSAVRRPPPDATPRRIAGRGWRGDGRRVRLPH
jgi:hypothetical protein